MTVSSSCPGRARRPCINPLEMSCSSFDHVINVMMRPADERFGYGAVCRTSVLSDACSRANLSFAHLTAPYTDSAPLRHPGESAADEFIGISFRTPPSRDDRSCQRLAAPPRVESYSARNRSVHEYRERVIGNAKDYPYTSSFLDLRPPFPYHSRARQRAVDATTLSGPSISARDNLVGSFARPTFVARCWHPSGCARGIHRRNLRRTRMRDSIDILARHGGRAARRSDRCSSSGSRAHRRSR